MKYIATAIVLLAFVASCFAGTKEEAIKILKGHTITMSDTCVFTKEGYLSDDKTGVIRGCHVAISAKDKNHFLLLVDDEKGQPFKIIRINITTEKQEILWVKGDST